MATKSTKPRLLDLFDKRTGVLPALDSRNKSFYGNLTDEQKKEFSPWLIQRYLSSAESSNNEIIEHYLIMTNKIVNVNFSEIKDHEILWKLMSIVGIGASVNHPFIPPPKKGSHENAFKQWLFDENPHLNKQELDILFHGFTKESAKDLLEQFQVKDKNIIKAVNDL
jgi:hypothetical protein